MKALITKVTADLMESHFDDDTINILYKKRLIQCPLAFKTAKQEMFEEALTKLVKEVTYKHNNDPRY